jgi:DNA-binding CsgD family transcriptional regulator
MQMQLPFFPTNTKLINCSLGFKEQDGTVYYLHNGNPIFCHSKSDLNGYRFQLANMVVNNLCTITELSLALGINRKNIERYCKSLRDYGIEYFFQRKEQRGQCYKMTPDKLSAIQLELDEGLSIYRIAKNHGISKPAVTYHIKNGNLKKN